ncbi:MAG: hypothetical protein KIC55_11255 [Lachnoanaerobaculum sp.]|uniref:hypothetical protein n=1 Tax=Lachnoanaerobaculum sp. TaxID=2049030 RepID=UPI0025BC5A16|nr:hypothetical protein [Lachnoanaerobaculum sp.]MBS5882922.1 hypothetical protein [Lachnoanaerobaculum sp.]
MIVLFNRVEVAKSIFDIVDDWNKLFSLIISIITVLAPFISFLYLLLKIKIEDPLEYSFKEKEQKETHVIFRSFLIFAFGSLSILAINTYLTFIFLQVPDICLSFYLCYGLALSTAGILYIFLRRILDKFQILSYYMQLNWRYFITGVLFFVCVIITGCLKHSNLSYAISGFIIGVSILISFGDFKTDKANKLLGSMFICSAFLCIPSYLYIFKLSLNLVIFIFTLLILFTYIFYMNKLLNYFTRLDLAYAYMYVNENSDENSDENNLDRSNKQNIRYILGKIDNNFIISTRDYFKCDEKDKLAFDKYIIGIEKKIKGKFDKKNKMFERNLLLNIIKEIKDNEYSLYLNKDEECIRNFFDVIKECCDNHSEDVVAFINQNDLENKIKNIENNFKFTLVNVESMDKVEIYPHIKNIKKFYDMLK